MLRKLGLMNFEQVLAREGCDLKKLSVMEPGELTKFGIAKDLAHELIGFCKVRMREPVDSNSYRAAPEVRVYRAAPNNGLPAKPRPPPSEPRPPPPTPQLPAAGEGPALDTVEGLLRHLGISRCLGFLNAENYEFRDLPIAEPEDLVDIGFTPTQARRLVTHFRPTH